jgi:hypothetical protein
MKDLGSIMFLIFSFVVLVLIAAIGVTQVYTDTEIVAAQARALELEKLSQDLSKNLQGCPIPWRE